MGFGARVSAQRHTTCASPAKKPNIAAAVATASFLALLPRAPSTALDSSPAAGSLASLASPPPQPAAA